LLAVHNRPICGYLGRQIHSFNARLRLAKGQSVLHTT
jgi:hypothetical protein